MEIKQITEIILKDWNNETYQFLYIGKHKVFSRITGDTAHVLEPSDLDPALLVECRLFNDVEEFKLVSDGNKLYARQFEENEASAWKHIEKKIQLRRDQSTAGIPRHKDNPALIARHYYDPEAPEKGYQVFRYIKINEA